MYSVCEQQPALQQKFEQLKSATCDLLSQARPLQENVLISSTENFLPQLAKSDLIYVVQEGIAGLSVRGQSLMVFENGDILWPELVGIADESALSLEFAIRVKTYPRSLLDLPQQSAAQRELREQFQTYRLQLILLIAGLLVKGERAFEPQMRWFEQGEVILKQGATDNEVYTLVQGEAHAYVNNIQVGVIKENEIFGALAALTGTPRTAQVMAAVRCMVLVLPKERFLELMNDRPSTVFKLVEDMAKTIVALNEKVVTLAGRAKNLFR